MSAQTEIVKRLFESRRNKARLNEGIDLKPYEDFYIKYYEEDTPQDRWESKMEKYLKRLDLQDKSLDQLTTNQFALKAYSLGRAAYFKMLTSPKQDKEFQDLVTEFKKRDEVINDVDLAAVQRNWKEGLAQGKKDSPYAFE